MATDYTTVLHGDAPEHRWPGREVDEEDVARSAGDPRDWFTAAERLQAHIEAKFGYRKAAGEDDPDWEPALILFCGDMGSGVSACIAHEAATWFKRGHPFFHYGDFNFGWRLGLDIHHTAAHMPIGSVVALRSGTLEVIEVLLEKCCRVLLEGPPWSLPHRIREKVTEVRLATRPKSPYATIAWDPANPVLVYQLWDDPDLADLPVDWRQSRFDPQLERVEIAGGEARTALLLTGTFRPVFAHLGR